jgi:hydrogenase maturation protein HypF
MECLNISVKGKVQGVGFRPFVYNLARELGVKGFIANTAEGVLIAAEGGDLSSFLERLRKDGPPLSRILNIDITPSVPTGCGDFSIKGSSENGSFTLVSPDASVCAACLHELLDPGDRRYLYPFINCTNCGPRYSITKSVPYDRVNTTMNVFRMCPECEAEYDDPKNRRFHAQPNACRRCGPRVALRVVKAGVSVDEKEESVSQTIRLLKEGRIIAIKGLGGFHLACDASNEKAVLTLRERKRRNNKPFALMSPEIGAIKKFCHVSEREESQLLSEKRPVLLLRKKEDFGLATAVSPNNKYAGFMLPYTPLHYLLFHHPFDTPYQGGDGEGPHFDALVMTSGNVSEEPIVIDNDEALAKLSGIADAFLLHDRGIFMRVDDSVVKVGDSGNVAASDAWPLGEAPLFFIRRARGFVPDPIPLHEDGPEVLGCGADLKNTFTLTKGRYAIPSQHIGDMENYETLRFFEETLQNLKTVYRAVPEAIAYDPHPAYLSSQWALRQEGIEKHPVQHHYAHIASVMAERGIKEKVIGISFDGTGYGEDGTLWGGEFLIADTKGFKRAGHLDYIPLPGGEMAVKEPWRISLAYLLEAVGEQIWEYIGPTGFVEKYGRERIEGILKISGMRDFSPLSSGAGRLFDAVSALIGVCDKNTFEGEAAMALESLVLDGLDDDYPVDIRFKEVIGIDFCPVILGILKDLGNQVDKRVMATKFHNTVSAAVLRTAAKLSAEHTIRKVALSGGVFQNTYLLRRVAYFLRYEGVEVYANELVPSNDAGISLGQAYILRERLRDGVKE